MAAVAHFRPVDVLEREIMTLYEFSKLPVGCRVRWTGKYWQLYGTVRAGLQIEWDDGSGFNLASIPEVVSECVLSNIEVCEQSA